MAIVKTTSYRYGNTSPMTVGDLFNIADELTINKVNEKAIIQINSNHGWAIGSPGWHAKVDVNET